MNTITTASPVPQERDVWMSLTVGWMAACAGVALHFLVSDSFGVFRSADGPEAKHLVACGILVITHLNAIGLFSYAVLRSVDQRARLSAIFAVFALTISCLMLLLAAFGISDSPYALLALLALDVMVLAAILERVHMDAVQPKVVIVDAGVLVSVTVAYFFFIATNLPTIAIPRVHDGIMSVPLHANSNTSDTQIRLIPMDNLALTHEGSNVVLIKPLRNGGEARADWPVTIPESQPSFQAILVLSGGRAQETYCLRGERNTTDWTIRWRKADGIRGEFMSIGVDALGCSKPW